MRNEGRGSFRRVRAGLILAPIGCGVLLWPQAPAPSQPLAFSHRIHAKSGLKCLDCHPIKDPGFAAGYPKEATCMACHIAIKADSPEIVKLAQYEKERKALRWVKIYKVPDNIYFSHQVHHKEAGIACSACHGPVEERDVIVKEKPTTMASCMACHERSGAPNDCAVCHDPG